MRNTKGFTIIELLLVIAILGSMIVFATTYVHKKSRQASIRKTALDMQNLLVAASDYYLLEAHRWPTAMRASDNSGLIDKDYFKDGLQCSPWIDGTGTGCDTSNSDYKNRAEYRILLANDDPQAPLFTLALDVGSEKLAKEIAVVLPTTFANGNTVYASIPIPGRAQDYTNALKIKVIKNDQYDSGNSDTKWQQLNPPSGEEIDCPPGWSKNFRAGLSEGVSCDPIFSSDFDSCQLTAPTSGTPVRRYHINMQQVSSSRSEPPNENNGGRDALWYEDASNSISQTPPWLNAITVNSDMPVAGDIHRGKALIIEYCVPPGYSDTSSTY